MADPPKAADTFEAVRLARASAKSFASGVRDEYRTYFEPKPRLLGEMTELDWIANPEAEELRWYFGTGEPMRLTDEAIARANQAALERPVPKLGDYPLRCGACGFTTHPPSGCPVKL